MQALQEATFLCPGQLHPVPRAIHLGRLAAFDPRCRNCQHRHDTGSLPDATVARLRALWSRESPPLWDDEGAAGLLDEQLDARAAGKLAAAFATVLRRATEKPQPQVTLAGDGRSTTAPLVAAASEALRWAGCRVIELPAATTACLLRAQHELQADGALLIGNAPGAVRTASVRFFGPLGQPVSSAGEGISLEALQRQSSGNFNRPARRSGGWQRGNAEEQYLQELSGYFHALRPLRFVLDTPCAPLARYLEKLLAHVGCRALPPSQAAGRKAGSLHFYAWIDGDGERLVLRDERGQDVAQEAVLLLLGRQWLADHAGATIVVEQDTSPSAVKVLEARGARIIRGGSSRAAMHHAMRQHGASLAGGRSGRWWIGAPPAPDALHVLAVLLNILSQNDRPFSERLKQASAAADG